MLYLHLGKLLRMNNTCLREEMERFTFHEWRIPYVLSELDLNKKGSRVPYTKTNPPSSTDTTNIRDILSREHLNLASWYFSKPISTQPGAPWSCEDTSSRWPTCCVLSYTNRRGKIWKGDRKPEFAKRPTGRDCKHRWIDGNRRQFRDLITNAQ